MQKSILITGVCGLVGSNFADWLIENHPEYKVIGIDNLLGGYMENLHPTVEFHKLNVAEADLKLLFDSNDIEYVYHFAAYAAEGLSPFMRKFNYSNNVLSTVNIINECIMHDVKRLVYTSSMSVYGHGRKDGTRFDENDTPCPIDPYGVSKFACEMDIRIANEQHGLDYCIIRPHNIIGPKQNIWDKYRNVIGIWMNHILHGRPITIYGDGTQTRAFSFIEDNMLPFWKAAITPEASKQIINVGGIVPSTINECAEMLCGITGTHDIVHLEGRHEVKYAVPTYQKSIDILGYKQNTLLEPGMVRMWEWAKEQPDRGEYKWEEYEITKGLYSYWQ